MCCEQDDETQKLILTSFYLDIMLIDLDLICRHQLLEQNYGLSPCLVLLIELMVQRSESLRFNGYCFLYLVPSYLTPFIIYKV